MAAIAAGSVIALLGYAGGGDVLSAWFGGGRNAPAPDTYDALAAPVLLDSIAADSALRSLGAAALVAARDTSASAAADTAAHPADSAATPSDSSAVNRPPVVESPGRATPPARDTVARRDSAAVRRPLSGRYVVQVRATADLQQAEQLARRLRSRGLAGVSITESSRDGETTYRVRYGAFPTEEEARASANDNDLSDIWIVRR